MSILVINAIWHSRMIFSVMLFSVLPSVLVSKNMRVRTQNILNHELIFTLFFPFSLSTVIITFLCIDLTILFVGYDVLSIFVVVIKNTN